MISHQPACLHLGREEAIARRKVGPMWVLLLAGVALLASACATPVGVTRVDTSAAYRILTESALSAQRPSEPSKGVLRRLGQLDRFDKEPAAVLADLHRGLGPAGDEDRLFALAELSFLHGERTGDRALFPGRSGVRLRPLVSRPGAGRALHHSDPRLRLAYALYNEGLARGLAGASAEAREAESPAAARAGSHRGPPRGRPPGAPVRDARDRLSIRPGSPGGGTGSIGSSRRPRWRSEA